MVFGKLQQTVLANGSRHKHTCMTSHLVDQLNKAQRQAVQATTGPILVLAGPGSGKTRVLIHRVAYLIQEEKVSPKHMLAVTFTNRAAREMRQRLFGLLSEETAYPLTIGTFHKICVRILRREFVHVGRERSFSIYDTDAQLNLIKASLKDLDLDSKQNPPARFLNTISRVKNELIGPAEFEAFVYSGEQPTLREKHIAACYHMYQHKLLQANALDFDDLLLETVRLFREQPPILDYYQDHYRHILVDEYQDTNHAQYTIVSMLAKKHQNLFVVGDDDQAIYSWRGADMRNILQFEHDYPKARVFLLEQNYRSTQNILKVAQAIISPGMWRMHRKQLWTEHDIGEPVMVLEGYDAKDEANRIASEVDNLVSTGLYTMRDIAIMYRTNAQSRAVEETLISYGFPYFMAGTVRFYERKEIKDVLAYLHFINNPTDHISLERIINYPKRGIGKRTWQALWAWAEEARITPFEALQHLETQNVTNTPFSSRAYAALVDFYHSMLPLFDLRHRLPLPNLIGALIERVPFYEAIYREYDKDEGKDRWNNIQELYNATQDYIAAPIEAQLETFLAEVALFTDLDSADEGADAITCVTLHQSKGLEFPVVFLAGMEEGLLPHHFSSTSVEEIEEERRLFYVGATRAKERLYLSRAFRRTIFGHTEVTLPSRFIADIPTDLLMMRSASGSQSSSQADPSPSPSQTESREQGGRSSRQKKPPSFRYVKTKSSTPASPPKQHAEPEMHLPIRIEFTPGQRVRHHLFGEGEVIECKPMMGDEEVVVLFDSGQRKKLLASFAKLELLG